jgi:uncharacterized protein
VHAGDQRDVASAGDWLLTAAPAVIEPTQEGERAALLDSLRGFSLFGVCIANILTGFSWWHENGIEKLVPRYLLPTDGAAEFLTMMFVDGKFYSLFSLLFGLGFALQLQRAEKRGGDALPTYKRRLRVLMGIGFLHLALLWTGDILLFYALMGLVLIRLRGIEDRKLVRWVVILVLLPIPFALPLVISPALSLGTPFYIMASVVAKGLGMNVESPTIALDTILSHRWIDLLKLNTVGMWFRFGGLFYISRPFKVLAMFLLGMLVGRHRVWERLDEFAPLLRRIAKWSFALGIPMCAALAAWAQFAPKAGGPAHELIETVFYALGVAPLAIGYAAGFALLWRNERWRSILSVLAPTGRMALTSYLTQSIIGVTVFYGIGFGLAGRVGPTYFIPMALAILAVQTVFATWWLKRYRFGPMEWIWRSITYRKRQPMLRGTR